MPQEIHKHSQSAQPHAGAQRRSQVPVPQVRQEVCLFERIEKSRMDACWR